MPHFIIECSDTILKTRDEESILHEIHQVANSSELFLEHEIKVRLKSFKNFLVGNKKEDFIHVFTHIMEGRTIEQKAVLAKAITQKLVALFPDVKNIAVNIDEFEKATYCNRGMLSKGKVRDR